jgi:hypothetical protein
MFGSPRQSHAWRATVGILHGELRSWHRHALCTQTVSKRSNLASPVPTTGERNLRLSRKRFLERIAQIALELGRAPSLAEFVSRTGVSKHSVTRDFSTWNRAVRAAGLKPAWFRKRLGQDKLLEDWGKAVRRNGAVPRRRWYQAHGKYDPITVEKRFGGWAGIPAAFLSFAEGRPQWSDVVLLVERALRWQHRSKSLPPLAAYRRNAPDQAGRELPPSWLGGRAKTAFQTLHKPLAGRPFYGNPVNFRGMPREPVNEQGVILLFGMLAQELGYAVESVQGAFPDCEAKRRVAPDKWQRVQIEFEFESKNFPLHGHSVEKCDVIVCWRHNWKRCPEDIEVLELSAILRR